MAERIYITAGFIEYSEQLQPGTFGSPQAKARFDFAIPDGESYEATSQLAAREAKNYVRAILGLKKAEAPAQPAPTTENRLEAAAAPAPQNDKEKLAQALVEKTTPPAPKKGKKAPALTVEPATGQAISAGDPGDDPKAPSDDDEIFGKTTEIVVVTDKELVDAAQAKNKALGDPEKILALRAKYAGPPPKQMRDIPKEKRAEFLKELAALT